MAVCARRATTSRLGHSPRLKLPKRLDGRTVLDVGAWDGFYSFEMERRGAAKVLATDHFCWGGNGWASQDGFNLARGPSGRTWRT